jgi:hypothetical protein
MAQAVGTLTLARRQTRRPPAPLRLDGALRVFWIAAAIYLVLAVVSVLVLDMMPGDSLSRVAIAQRVMFSRDPHLAAVGFVWNPLQTLPLVPLVPVKLVWPDFVRLGFAAAMVSVAFMAGAVYQLHAILRDFGVRPLPRVLLTALFALHPMILYYAVNGMSEAMLLFFLLIAVRQLGNWLWSRDTLRLVYAGLALGIAYLSRYEALAPAAAAVALVLLVSLLRSRGQAWDRIAIALSDTLIIGIPVAAAFIFWAVASWIIVGQPFEALTSAYGNSVHMQVAQYQRVAAAVEFSRGWLPATTMAFRRMLTLEPFLLILLFVAAVQIFRRRAQDAVVPLAIFGAVLLFMVGAYLRGAVFGDLRYFIAVIPVAILLIGALLPGRQPRPPAARPLLVPNRPPGRIVSLGTSALLVALAVVSLPISAVGMSDRSVAPTQSDELSPVINLVRHPGAAPVALRRNVTERAVAHAVDALHLGSGKVLLDVFVGYPIVLYSDRPNQFVIPSDRDWRVAISGPAADGVEYFLVPSPTNPLAALDDLNRTYPGIFETGAGIGQPIETFPGVGHSGAWRLFRVVSHATAEPSS